jgi:hypothetical protein
VALFRRFARARLASQVIRRLRRAGVAGARYDARAFAVRFTRSGDDVPTVMELGGLLADRSGGRRERRARTQRFVAGFLRSPGMPADWATARPLIRPVLRGTTAMPAGVSAPLRRPALPFLAEYVVVDQPDTMTYVSADQLTDWEVTADAVFAAARENLSGAVLQGVATEPTVVQFVDDGDAYWTSHLLVDGWLARLGDQVGGVPVAFAPERGSLIITADGSAHLTGLFARVESAYAASPRAISPMAYASDERGRTVPYDAPDGHPMHVCVKRAMAVLAATEYARQQSASEAGPDQWQHAGADQREHTEADQREHAEADQRKHAEADQRQHDAAHMAELRIAGSERDGWRTRAIWPRDEPTLLPRADEIQIGDRIAAWDEVAAHLTEVPGLDPPRWRAESWPTL